MQVDDVGTNMEGTEASLLIHGLGPSANVMGIKRGAIGRKCPSWALSPLVLISVSVICL